MIKLSNVPYKNSGGKNMVYYLYVVIAFFGLTFLYSLYQLIKNLFRVKNGFLVIDNNGKRIKNNNSVFSLFLIDVLKFFGISLIWPLLLIGIIYFTLRRHGIF